MSDTKDGAVVSPATYGPSTLQSWPCPKFYFEGIFNSASKWGKCICV